MPNIGDKKNVVIKISNADLGYVNLTVSTWGAFMAALEAFLKRTILKKLAASVTGLLPGLIAADIALAIVGLVSEEYGHNGIKITVRMTYRQITKHQGGGVVTIEGWQPTGYSVSWY